MLLRANAVRGDRESSAAATERVLNIVATARGCTPMTIQSVRRYAFTVPAVDVWTALTDVDDYVAWWPWLEAFDGSDFRVGSRWQCTVRSPLRYGVHFQIELVDVAPPAHASADVEGDIAGSATLDVRDTAGGSELRLVSDLAANVGLVAVLDRIAPRLTEAAHHRILDDGFRRFRDRNSLDG